MTVQQPLRRRRSPRADVVLACVLRRRIGSPIRAETIDLGPGGMRVRSPRPLSVDELLDFRIESLDPCVAGHARVLREEPRGIYALCFGGLDEDQRDCLLGVVTAAG